MKNPRNGRTTPKHHQPTIYIHPALRKKVLPLWTYPMLRCAFDVASDDDFKADIAAEMARRGGVR